MESDDTPPRVVPGAGEAEGRAGMEAGPGPDSHERTGVRMSVARRGTGAGLGAALLAMLVVVAAAGPIRAEAPPVRLTVEVAWRSAPAPTVAPQGPIHPGAVLELDRGRVVQALPWPEDDDPAAVADLAGPEPIPGGAWRLGAGPSGRVRLRIEAPIDGSATVRLGGSSWTLPLLALLDGPQRTPLDGGSSVEIRRLPWDALEVQAPGDGSAGPGAIVPVTVAINVLAPEPTEVEATLSARLRPIRGDRAVWEDSRRLVVPTNAPRAPGWILPVPMPDEEGTYELELSASWAPRGPQPDASRLGRWWRRLRPHRGPDASTRRISLAVVAPTGTPPAPGSSAPAPAPAPSHPEVVVDSAELGRSWWPRTRPEGRALTGGEGTEAAWEVPATLLVEPIRRDRAGMLLARVGPEGRALPPAGPDGLSWAAAPLGVAHPGRPHRVDLTVIRGDPRAAAVALIAPGARPRLLLDARGSGPVADGTGAPVALSWPTWPDAADLVLVVVNRSPDAPLTLGTASIVELPEGPPRLPVVGPPPDGGRSLAIRFAGPGDLDRFGGDGGDGPADPVARGENLASYLGSLGASAAVLPAGRPDRMIRGALEGQADEDPIGPDGDAALRSALKRRGFEVVVDVPVDRAALPGLPPAGSAEAESAGLVRIGRDGRAEPDWPTYNLLRSEVQQALARHVEAAIGGPDAPASARPDGLLLRLGPGPTLPGRADTGFDDATYARFVSGAITGASAPGLDAADPGRFAARHAYVTGPASVPWLTWRSRQVAAFYAGLAAGLAERAPGCRLLIATPGLDDGPNGSEARRFDREGLPPEAAWRSLGLDLADWPKGDGPSPIFLRGASADGDGLARDLASHPSLDATLLDRPARGLLLGLDECKDGGGDGPASPPRLSAGAAGREPGEGEPFGHAMAALDASWVVVSASVASGMEDRLREFARVYRALPRPGGGSAAPPASGVVARATTSGERTYLAIANDTPFPVRLSAVVATPGAAEILDLGRGSALEAEPVAGGGRRATIDLPSFGVSALRVGASGARLASLAATFDGAREEHHRAASKRLQELASGGASALLNPGFEPDTPVVRASSGAEESGTALGWAAEGPGGPTLAIDPERARSGRGSLRLTSAEGGAAAASPGFAPPGPEATLRAWLRTDPPDAGVRIRIESEPGAAEPVRLAADLPAADRSDWWPLALRAPGLPSGPGAAARIRFELRTPGRLWVDDLSLVGPGLSQARSCLTAALQAYDEGRYADFARLSRSHWVDRAGGPIVPASAVDAGPTPPAGVIATDLPGRPRLR